MHFCVALLKPNDFWHGKKSARVSTFQILRQQFPRYNPSKIGLVFHFFFFAERGTVRISNLVAIP